MKSIEERAQEHYPVGCGYVGSLNQAYVVGAKDQLNIDAEFICQWLDNYVYNYLFQDGGIDKELLLDDLKKAMKGEQL